MAVATRDGLKLKVEADTSDADRKLSALERKSRSLLSAAIDSLDRPMARDPVRGDLTPFAQRAHTGKYYAATTDWGRRLGLGSANLGDRTFASSWDARKAGIIQARAIRKELVASASSIGMAIGSFIAKDAAAVYFHSRETVGGSNSRNRMAQRTVDAGIGGAMAGGGAVAGILAALGMVGALPTGGLSLGLTAALVGGGALAAGGASALLANKDERITQNQQWLQSQHTNKSIGRSLLMQSTANEADFAMGQMMSRSGSRTDRLQMLRASLGSYRRDFAKLRAEFLEKSGQYADWAETEQGKEQLANIGTLSGRILGTEQKINAEKTMPMQQLLESSSMQDSLSRRGIYVGANVDVSSTNTQILSILKEQLQFFKDRWESMRGGERRIMFNERNSIGRRFYADDGAISVF